jgi:DNA-binding GntR family transcriptional regulator
MNRPSAHPSSDATTADAARRGFLFRQEGLTKLAPAPFGVGESAVKYAGKETDQGSSEWKAVAEALEMDIIFGRLLPREHLVEDGLMARFNKSRYAVRRALEEMQAIGLVVKEPNRGTHVRGYSREEVEGLFEIRDALETRAAMRIKLPCDPALIEALTTIQREHEQVSDAGLLLEMFHINNAFHDAIFEACGIPVLVNAIKFYSTQTQPIRMRFFPDPARRREAVAEHWGIIEALRGSDNASLANLGRLHRLPIKSYYLKIHGFTPREDG